MTPRCSNPALFGGGHHDLDQRPRIGELRLDAGARRQVLGVDPRAPYLVHRRAVADVGDPDLRLQDLRLVRAALAEQAVDLVQHFFRLSLDVLLQALGDDASEVHGAAVLDGLRKDAARIVAHDAHFGFLLTLLALDTGCTAVWAPPPAAGRTAPAPLPGRAA